MPLLLTASTHGPEHGYLQPPTLPHTQHEQMPGWDTSTQK
jgi:hypothetical protein